MTATLYAVPASHPCAAVEKALQIKGIVYRRVDVPPVAHKAIQRVLFGRGTVPGLVLDGEKVIGSRAIVRALEEKVPEPRLLPADEKERKSVGLAEEWGDEVLQPLARRAIWLALRRSPGALASYGEGARLPIPDAVTRLTAPVVAAAEQRINAGSELMCAPTSPRSTTTSLGSSGGWITTWWAARRRTQPICRSAQGWRCC